jgi:hypothetical protein
MVFEVKAQSCHWSSTGCSTSVGMYRSGAVGIGTSSAPTSYILEVDGDVNFPNPATRFFLNATLFLHVGSNYFHNVYLGTEAGLNELGASNTYIGAFAGTSSSSGGSQTFIGANAGNNSDNSNHNTFVGADAGFSNTSASNNTFIGSASGAANTTGFDNTFTGYFSGNANTIGFRNQFYGFRSGRRNTSGYRNIFIGGQSGHENLDGHDNICIGDSAGFTNQSGNFNVYLGNYAGYASTNNGNVAIGFNANSSGTTSSESVYIGEEACVGIGGDGNVGIGRGTALNASGTTKTTIIGWEAAPDLVDGEHNIFIGDESGIGFTIENHNVVIGTRTELISGGGSPASEITLLGYQTLADGNIVNATAIGANARVCDDNTLVLGEHSGNNTTVVIGYCSAPNASGSELEVAGDVWSNGGVLISDKRFKTNITQISNPLEIITKISGYNYSFKTDEFSEFNFPKVEQSGLIAQELLEHYPYAVKEGKSGYYGVRYNAIIPLLLEAIKEQQKQIDSLKIINAEPKKLNIQNETSAIYNKSIVESEIRGKLQQNRPNPFSNETIISYEIDGNFQKAQIVIMDFNGNEIKNYPIKDSRNEFRFNGDFLSPGIYFYSLFADNNLLDVRKMIIAR